ncbi:hypothetical protein TNCV_3556391 [Trichonephila clavipes]|nr:hypothetical protein TNCV_3556391 [Trichonephila clavipes]
MNTRTVLPNLWSHGCRVVKVSDRGYPCHEFKLSTTNDPPSRGAMHVKSVESSNIIPLVWWLGEGDASSGVVHVT